MLFVMSVHSSEWHSWLINVIMYNNNRISSDNKEKTWCSHLPFSVISRTNGYIITVKSKTIFCHLFLCFNNISIFLRSGRFYWNDVAISRYRVLVIGSLIYVFLAMLNISTEISSLHRLAIRSHPACVYIIWKDEFSLAESVFNNLAKSIFIIHVPSLIRLCTLKLQLIIFGFLCH